LGVGETSEKFWSVVTIMQIVELPGGFINRQDGIMLAFWLLSIFSLLSAYMFYLARITSEFLQLCIPNYFKKDNQETLRQTPISGYTIIFFGVLAYFTSLLVTNIEEEFVNFGRYFAYIGVPQSILIPFVILLVSKIRYGKGKNVSKKEGVSS